MSDWRARSQILGDVVFFRYVDEGQEQGARKVFVWDLDKTYLDTSWHSLGELLRTALERSFHKKNIPGTKTLIRELARDLRGEQFSQVPFPLYFITASPPQMEERIAQKLALDGIRPYGAFYKDNLRNLHPKRWYRLTKQVGYKIQALLQLRLRLRQGVRQVFWGDDSETDAIIYNLYSDICARRISPQEIRHVLKYFYVTGEQVDGILHLQSQVPPEDPVDKIYINLAEDTDADYYLKFGRRTLPTANTFQMCLDLVQDEMLSVEAAVGVARDMMVNYGFTREQLSRSLDALIRRQILAQPTVEKLIPALKEAEIVDPDYRPSLEPVALLGRGEEGLQLAGVHEPWIADRIDYLRDYR